MCFRLCCDPHKLAYISALVTSAEAVLFGALNLTLILMNLCVFKPKEELGAGLDKFWSWYFFDNETCNNRYDGDLHIPGWIVNQPYPIQPRPNDTSVEANFRYQITYLVLHALWLLSAPILIYGNARKRWGYYIPWLLISCTFLVMDVVLAAFFIRDMTDAEGTEEVGPMIWMFSLYLRGFLFWFTNLGQTATVMNAFCKSRHKRVKQEMQRKKQQQKHEHEMSEATAEAAAQARAEAQAEIHQQTQSQSPPPAVQQVPVVQQQPGIDNMAYVGMQQNPYGGMPQDPYTRMYPDPHQYEQQRMPHQGKAPKEVRPFSYLNPGFRPNDPSDVLGMKKNPSGLPESTKGHGYFTALPPRDYDDDDSGPPVDMTGLPRVSINMNISGGTPYRPTAPRNEDFQPQQHNGPPPSYY